MGGEDHVSKEECLTGRYFGEMVLECALEIGMLGVGR